MSAGTDCDNSEMGNLLLVVPPNLKERDFFKPPPNVKVMVTGEKEYGSVITDMPLGVISLAAYIKAHTRFDVKVLDFNVELHKATSMGGATFRQFFEIGLVNVTFDNGAGPDVVGLSTLFSTAYLNTIELADLSKKLFPEALLLAGGNVPTVSYKELFRDTDKIDAVCYGEGDKPLLALLQSSDMWSHINDHSSNWVKRSDRNKPKTDFQHDFIWDLDEVPFDYSVIDEEDYQINPTINYYTGIKEKGKSFNIMTSRGCPYMCIFCASHATHGRSMRYESLERVKSNISELKEKHDVKVITFEDDHFMGDQKRALEIVRFVGDIGLTAFFPNSLALYALNRKMLEALKAAGVDQLILAVESGSSRVLNKVMKKPLKLDIIDKVIENCADLGIYTDCNIVTGLPGETKEDINDTCDYLRALNANWFRINIATPLLGSEMNEICKEKGYFKGDVVDSNYKKGIIETDDWSVEFIQQKTYEMNLDLNFAHNPDMRQGRWDIALRGFKNALAAKSDHAFAHYFSSICYEKMGETEKSVESRNKAMKIVAEDSFWANYAEMFALDLRTAPDSISLTELELGTNVHPVTSGSGRPNWHVG